MSTALDLPEQVIQCLEASPIFKDAFGDTYDQDANTGTAKIFSDFADQVSLPYAVLTEPGENYDFMTATAGNWRNFIATGQMMFEIYAGSRYQARMLGFVIAGALNDANFFWAGINSQMEFRMMSSRFIPTTDPSGPMVPIMFRRMFLFEYVYSSSLPLGSL